MTLINQAECFVYHFFKRVSYRSSTPVFIECVHEVRGAAAAAWLLLDTWNPDPGCCHGFVHSPRRGSTASIVQQGSGSSSSSSLRRGWWGQRGCSRRKAPSCTSSHHWRHQSSCSRGVHHHPTGTAALDSCDGRRVISSCCQSGAAWAASGGGAPLQEVAQLGLAAAARTCRRRSSCGVCCQSCHTQVV